MNKKIENAKRILLKYEILKVKEKIELLEE